MNISELDEMTQGTELIERDINISFMCNNHTVYIKWIQYEESSTGFTLLNKKVYINDQRMDMRPSFFTDGTSWIAVMEMANDQIFKFLEDEVLTLR